MSLEQTFEGFAELYEDNRIRAVGVSNFTINHVKDALKATELPVGVNQVEFHPFLYQEDLLEFCDDNDIKLTAYSPIARGKVLKSDVLNEIGENHGKTAAQVSLRWLLQHGMIAIPKSSSEEHLRENLDVFDFHLSDGEVEKIDNLNREERLINPGFADFDY